jgi:hypothetical protein
MRTGNVNTARAVIHKTSVYIGGVQHKVNKIFCFWC